MGKVSKEGAQDRWGNSCSGPEVRQCKQPPTVREECEGRSPWSHFQKPGGLVLRQRGSRKGFEQRSLRARLVLQGKGRKGGNQVSQVRSYTRWDGKERLGREGGGC